MCARLLRHRTLRTALELSKGLPSLLSLMMIVLTAVTFCTDRVNFKGNYAYATLYVLSA